MMPSTASVKPTTPVSTVSSVGTNNTATAVQSGPYTKAQFQNTMEGSRSIKNPKEIEQLLRDYPAALELYRTGRYKVKIKNEADIERVILVEKRTNKNPTTNGTKTNDLQQNLDVSSNVSKIKEDIKKEQSRSRTHSRDRTVTTTSVTDNNALVQTTTSSIRMPSNTQPKVDNHRTSSKEREVSITSQSKQQQQQQQQQEQTCRRSHSHDSRSKLSHSKRKGKKSNRDYQNAIVPYVPNVYPVGNIWQHSRALQPYYSNPILTHQQPMSNIYSPYMSQQNPFFQQPYYYGQQPFPAAAYQKPSVYPPTSSTIKSIGTINNPTVPSTNNYPPSSQPTYKANQGATLPPSFHTFHPNQQQYSHPHAMYQSQLPLQIPLAWPGTANRPAGNVANNNNTHMENLRSAQHRARSVDTGPRGQPPARSYNQQQQTAPIITEHHHHHRHHQHRSHPTNVQSNNTGPAEETGKDQNVSLKETTTAASNGTNGEKLTIRQLNEIFLQTDPSGRLPYSSIPNILQRFSITLTENDLILTAQSLDYNANEPLSARRLVHVLIKLGKIAKSTQQQQQQRSIASPTILPEDREVNDIMTQRKAAGVVSTHIHSSAYPNYWY